MSGSSGGVDKSPRRGKGISIQMSKSAVSVSTTKPDAFGVISSSWLKVRALGSGRVVWARNRALGTSELSTVSSSLELFLVLARVTSKRRPVRDAVGAFPAAGVVGAVGAAPADAFSGSPAVPGTMLGDATSDLFDAIPREAERG